MHPSFWPSFSLQVPTIYWHLSTNRILTMEFAEGGQVNDKDYMKKHGINVNEVRQTAPSASANKCPLCTCPMHGGVKVGRRGSARNWGSNWGGMGEEHCQCLCQIRENRTAECVCVCGGGPAVIVHHLHCRKNRYDLCDVSKTQFEADRWLNSWLNLVYWSTQSRAEAFRVLTSW